MRMNKRGFEFSFTWLFAIFVGAVIIFVAIFATTSLVKTSRTEADTKVASQLGTLLNPVETNLEESKYARISFPDETRVYNECDLRGNFGRQIISTSVRSGIGSEFQEPTVKNSFFNKYLFSKSVEEGKELHVFVKPFEMPYKVADLVFASSGEYCFVNPPTYVEDEVSDLGLGYIHLSGTEAECPSGSDIVCFGKTGCDIDVNLGASVVLKDGKELYYTDSLIYGAIFAEPDIYECQVKRLMRRTGELAHLYASKTEFLSARGCSSTLSGDLREFASLNQIENSEELLSVVSPASENIRRKNENLICRLF